MAHDLRPDRYDMVGFLRDLAKRVNYLERTVGGSKNTLWVPVTSFGGGWVNYDAPAPAARNAAYCKINGIVFVRGVIKNGVIGSAAFNLPIGFRPKISNQTWATNSNALFGVVEVRSDGQVTPTRGDPTYVFLDVICFPAF